MSDFTIVAGKPYNYDVVFVDAVNIWPAVGQFEHRATLRVLPDDTSRFIANLHNWMTKTIDGNDIVIQWRMTGDDTRSLYGLAWGNDKIGYFNLDLTDIGSTDTRALHVPPMQVQCVDITTGSSGSVT